MANLATHYSWQTEQWQHFTKQHASNKLPHALLLLGSEGVGKHKFAEAMAHYLLCNQPKDGVACGSCKSCALNVSGTHPDFQFVTLEDKAKAIKIDQIRSLNSFMSKTPQQGGYRVTIIAPCDAMNINAANALLKTLEEPGPDSILILCSNQLNDVMPTIRSRCQQLRFEQPSRSESMAWLSNIVTDTKEADTLLEAANGSPLKALALQETGEIELRLKLEKNLDQLLNRKAYSATVAKDLADYEAVTIVYWWQRILASSIKYKLAAQKTKQDVNKSFASLADTLESRVSNNALFMFLDELNKACERLRSGANPNPALLLDNLLNRWSHLPNH